MRQSYQRFVNAGRETATVTLEHQDAPGKFTQFGELKYNRLTGEIHITWCYECPLSILTRLKESLRFIKFLMSL